MPVAHLADRPEVAVGRDDDPVRPRHRLEDHRGDGVRAFVLQDLLEVRRAGAHGARIGMTGGAAVRVRVEHAHDAGDARLGGPAARVAGERDRAGRRAVVAAIARDDLVAAGVPACELDRVLVRLGAAVREERHRDVARRHLGDQARERRARLGCHRRADRAELVGLLLDRGDEPRVLVADRDVDELRREVEVALAVVVPEVAALGAGNRNRVERVLHRPRVEDVALRVLDDLPAELCIRFDRRHAASLRDGHPDPLDRVVAVPAEVPLGLERLRVADRIGGAAAELELARPCVPRVAPAAPGVRARGRPRAPRPPRSRRRRC